MLNPSKNIEKRAPLLAKHQSFAVRIYFAVIFCTSFCCKCAHSWFAIFINSYLKAGLTFPSRNIVSAICSLPASLSQTKAVGNALSAVGFYIKN